MKDAIFSPDGTRILAVADDIIVGDDHTVFVWDAESGLRIGEPMRYPGHVFRAGFNPDGTKILTTGSAGTTFWNGESRHVVGQPMRHEGKVSSARFSADGTRILTESDDNSLRVWDAVTGLVLGEPIRHPGRLAGATYSPDGTRFLTAVDNQTVIIRDAATGHAVGEAMHHGSRVISATFSLDGTRIVTAGGDNNARIWEAATGRVIGKAMNHPGLEAIPCFDPGGTRIVTVSRDGTVRVWDASTGQFIGDWKRTIGGGARSAAFSPDGTRIVIRTFETTARVLDSTTGRVLGPPMRHEGRVTDVNFSPDGTRIVTAGEDHTARVWDAASGRVIGQPMRHQGGVASAAFSPDGTRIVTAGGDNTARVWWMLTPDESKALPSTTPRTIAWARAMAGLRFNEDGELGRIAESDRFVSLTNPDLPSGSWAELARWINTPVPHRTIDPKSALTLRQIAERERDFDGNGTVDSLESALRYDPTVPLARLFLAAALEKADARKPAKARDPLLPQRAAFLRRYDLDALAKETGRMKHEELAALWVRAANHLTDLPADTKIGVGPKPTTAREESGKAARKALELVPGLPAAGEILKKL
ncbi:MAG: WD40 repeat domain-containing protein [Verrucomicrobiota bacterium]